MKPVLCQPIDFQTLLTLVADDQWVFQQKLDGTRLLVEIDDGKVTGYSRRGERTRVPQAVSTALSAACPEGHFVLDGELMGPMYNIFDMPVAGDLISPHTSYYVRLLALITLRKLNDWRGPITLLKTAEGLDAKGELVRQAIEAGSEGIIARRVSGVYHEGKRSAYIYKWKNIRDVDVVVMEKGRNDKDNLVIGLFNDKEELVEVGAVSALTGDGPRVNIGDVIQVTYLYTSEDGQLVQPVTPRLRTDKMTQDCTLDQLTYTNKEVLG